MATITCPTGCSNKLPKVKFDKCKPVLNLSEIQTIYVASVLASAFADVKDPVEWAERLSEDSILDDDIIRPLTVIADKALGAPIIKELSNDRKATIRLDQTVNVEIDDVSDENYDFARTMQCGGLVKMWYKTKAGKMYGGNEGIQDVFLQLDIINARGKDEIEKIQGTATWGAPTSPERTVSPI